MIEPVAEPVIGYRRWRVTNTGHLAPLTYPARGPMPRLDVLTRLISVDQDAWRDGRATARCATTSGLCGAGLNCSCGLYAYHRPGELHRTPGTTVTGAIVAWGRIIVHQTGFRAEHARPIGFAEPKHHHSCTTDAVAALYGGQTGWACCAMDPRLPVRMGDRYEVPVLPMDELVVYAGWFGDTLTTPPAAV